MPKRDWIVAGFGALGGAMLTMVTSLIIEERKADHELRRDRAARIAAMEEQAASERRKLLEALAASFDDLGDVPRRAVEFAETGRRGSADDVRSMFVHFTRVMRSVRTGSVTAREIALYYGEGRIRGWGGRFAAIANGTAPAFASFSAYERYNFGILGDALGALALAKPPSDRYNSGSNAMVDTGEGNTPAPPDA